MDISVRPAVVKAEETLDPDDWSGIQTLSHQVIDDAVGYLRNVRERPVWQDMPDQVRAVFDAPLPKTPAPIADVYREVSATVMSYPMGNIHPRFWSWYMGSSNFTGALGDFLAAIQGSNLGGGNHAAALMDQQVVNWCKEMLGFPASASGTLVSGGSMANIIGLTVARNVKAGIDVREHGVAAIKKPLRFYGSDQLHSCHRKAMEALGLGNLALRRIATDADLRIDLAALRAAIAEDRAAGFQPACVIGTAGTVNTGAVDDLQGLAALAAEEGLWFHVDGCIGALIAIAPENAWRVAGIEYADSVALDPHKWLHAPFEVGCALVRDASAHRNTFAVTPEYLEMTSRGLASANWLHEYGLQTSRGFRALKVWMSLKEHGVLKFGRLIDKNIGQGHFLNDLIEAEPLLELVATTSINIVCYRYRPDGFSGERLKALNTEIMLRLQEEGTASISDTTVRGEHCLRVAVNNHRTRQEDLDLLVRETLALGSRIANGN
ncbi:pyridoxal phosphate-dependent decarboxylase family protein [Phyllobacterium endophyticum]|uniref:Amino acid decarboxylase n=1 Tax=Phyllobacterium endophyticum TaxID=1149773 RepID=A0A2P7AWU6_9HYPH|nr:pyridoxal-dependent decarboxylase [Phyllobacterium endophyticum]MBB3238208.1 glutamate/tyrosine decarboxylase-like PLP-dependent enzyme [Phyllobacterium endophyticum]PSH58682.1 amino acid decarboxylase [Phyllobacterium endophyticum]TYR39373.1 amino acid decarboxylase [Phyllobacterium endophyticum]